MAAVYWAIAFAVAKLSFSSTFTTCFAVVRPYIFFYLLSLITIALSIPELSKGQSISINGHMGDSIIDLYSYFELLDTTAETAPQSPKGVLASTQWEMAATSHMLTKNKDVQWARLSISSSSDSILHFMLSIPFSDYVSYFVYKDSSLIYQGLSGDLVPVPDRPVRNGRLVFLPVELSGVGEYQILLKIESISNISGQFRAKTIKNAKLLTSEAYLEEAHGDVPLQLLFFGSMLIMLFYNLILSFSLKSKEYGYYVVYLAFISLFLFAERGYLAEFALPYYPRLDLYVRFMCPPLTCLAYLLFAEGFLKAKEYTPIHHKLLKSIGLGVLANSLIFIALLGWWQLGRQINIALAAAALLSSITTAIAILRKGYTPAKYFLLANSLFIAGGLVFVVLKAAGEMHHWLGDLSFQSGIALQVALLSLGLADRINVSRRMLTEETLSKERLIADKERERKELLMMQNLLLEKTVDERTAELKEQKEILEQTNTRITKSIQYAKRIQTAVLGEYQQLQQLFPKSSMLWLPKDIVSGDFFWLGEAKGKSIVIAADCTGHGVPGAFMTVMGHTLLNDAIRERGIWKPDEILYFLEEKVGQMLHSENSEGGTQDGMDISIISYDKVAGVVYFSGAKNPLCHIGQGKLNRIKGSKMGIGGNKRTPPLFDCHAIPVLAGDRLYIYSDGFQDQFGGDKGKKFMSTKFRELLSLQWGNPMLEQAPLLEDIFFSWKGKLKQTDDVLVIGIEIDS